MEELTGSIERLTYYDEESFFTVAQLKCAHQAQTITVVGTIPSVQVGETIHCKGSWKKHLKHGLRFEISSYTLHLPNDAKSIEKFLSSGAVKGIGPAYAAKIVEKFGQKTIEILENYPERLSEVEGLGTKRADSIVQSWSEHKSLQELFLFLHGYGISRTYARKILRSWGNFALQKLKENPWRLAKEIRGIGFTLADQIAKNLGLTPESKERVDAGVDFVLYELSQEGHVCFPLHLFVERVAKTLQVSHDLIELQLGRLFQSGEIELRKHATENGSETELMIWARALFLSENGISNEAIRLQKGVSKIRQVHVEKAIDWAQETIRITFAPLQKTAISQALSEKLCIITGGPGTGKSTITKAIVTIFSKLSNKILLAAPTGRAAKRLSEITRRYASTLHRILKFDFTKRKFKHDRDCPIDCELVIIDEASMIDTYLMYQVLRAIPTHARVIIIGDAHQLPSVGPGNVLRDLIASHTIPVTELTTIFRQAQGSKIITNAHRINQGQMPYTGFQENSDFFFIEAKEPQDVLTTIVDLVNKKVPGKYGYDPKKEIQVLSPMRKGICGIDALNKELQEVLTPSINGNETKMSFRIGDKVMQLKNNYSKDVFNGDIGYVSKIITEEHKVLVEMDEKEVEYEFSELDEICLAYAVSIHKFQGSECPCVIMPVHTTHFKLLTKNLLYTGVTRGKKLVILVGTKKALAIGVKNQEVEKRYTGLKHILLQGMTLPNEQKDQQELFL